MTHHGWIPVAGKALPAALLSPFGRLFPARSLSYNSHAISMLAGAHGPMEETVVRDADGKPVVKDGKIQINTVFKADAKNPLPTGFTFLGQFIDHDLTEFRVATPELGILPQNPTLGQRQRVHEDGEPTATNGRSGRLDLDSVYGLLGSLDLHLFDDAGNFRNRKEGDIAIDIRRDVDYRDGRLIADPRNDENKIIVQLHILFERLHDTLHVPTSPGQPPEKRADDIETTRTQVVKIYRQIVLYDYLPRITGTDAILQVWEQLKLNKAFYQAMNRRVRDTIGPLLEELVDWFPLKDGRPPQAPQELDSFLRELVAMPVEFAHAVFRLGHTQLLEAYRLQVGQPPIPLFFTGPVNQDPAPTQDLRGNAKIEPPFVIDWQNFFGPSAANGRPLDPNLPRGIFRLPPPAVGEPPVSLAERNIRRGIDFGLPSGQEAARILGSVYGGVDVLTPDQILDTDVMALYPELRTMDAGFAVATPLWFYVLQEAALKVPVEPHLGPVGALIVAETILGSLAASEDFDLAQCFAGGAQGFTDAIEAAKATPTVDDEQQIRTMVQLLNHIGTPV
ncbi:MAG: hypothetical protein V7774_16125 [Pseudorhizobium pelagicum]|uniref:hypothetical protein n=1 Tax=Pseudorhizobium pelagicum TaxID=1509405 RepID=UPI00345FAE23